MSLIGLSPVIQNSGDAESRSVAHSAVRARQLPTANFAAPRSAASHVATPKNRNHAARDAPGAANRRPDRERPRLGGRPGRRGQALDDRQRNVPHQHVDGIAGRMRLVQRRVEMAQPEREVDRVDVFERRRQKRQVRSQVDGGDCHERRIAAPRRLVVSGRWLRGAR